MRFYVLESQFILRSFMKRIHLFEIHDQSWCPSSIRNGLTGYLEIQTAVFRFFDPTLSSLSDAMNYLKANQIVDLCSGGAGPWLRLQPMLEKRLQRPVKVLLTDKYPNKNVVQKINSEEGRIKFYGESVDAMDVPSDIKGFRTLFMSFHHFKPEVAQNILQNAINSHQGIGIFESTERSFLSILSYFFPPIFSLFLTPFIKPFKWSRLFWTYIIPVIPFVILFDGIVSGLRTYTPKELALIIAKLDKTKTYDWEVKKIDVSRIPLIPIHVTYLLGVPKKGI